MRLVLCAAVLAAVVGFVAAAADGFISSDALQTSYYTTTGWSLLQIKKNCPVNFKAATYTAITSRCGRLLYETSQCCAAFKDFACPYAAYLNDNTTDCALTMFGYIHFQGYPPGLFADNCSDGPDGVKCPDDTPPAPTSAAAPLVALVATTFALSVSMLMS